MRLMCFLFLLFTANSFALEKTNVTANWAEQYIKQNHPSLMVDSQFDHVLSVYYFGQYGNRSLLGLERVRGENYEQFFTILVFEDSHLLGYYENVLSFPSTINEQGEVGFPYGISGEIKEIGESMNLNAAEFGDLCQTQAHVTQCFTWQAVAYKNLK